MWNIFGLKNWKDIHLDFTSELQKKWEKGGFTYEECEKWLSTGLKPSDVDYIQWLIVIKKTDVKWFLNHNHNNDRELREEYIKFLEEVTKGSKLSVETINQIKTKNFSHFDLSFDPSVNRLISKLIPNEELRERYKKLGLCQECQQPNTGSSWCQTCNARHFQDDFLNWTSENSTIDKYIQEYQLSTTSINGVLEWIPYEQFTNIEFLAEGGFGKVYKAEWIEGHIMGWNIKDNKWERGRGDYSNYSTKIALKTLLNNSQDIIVGFLREITHNKLFDFYNYVAECHGISKDPKTKNYVMVMEYIERGNLRQYLQNNGYSEIGGFEDKLRYLIIIARGLNYINNKGLVHKDFHSGNILAKFQSCCIADFGLCRSTDETTEKKIYGVLPYVAPEVLQGQPYTQASDIYSFGIVAYELLAQVYPYPELDGLDLALKVCNGLRPNIDELKIPQELKNLIKRCWDADALRRTTTEELERKLNNFFEKIYNDEINTEFYQQYQETKDEYKYFSQNTPYQICPNKVTTSKIIDTKQIAELVKKIQKNKENSSNPTKITEQIKEIEKKLEEFKKPLNNELAELVEKFVEVKKKLIKDKKNKETKIEARKLGKQLEEKGLSEKKMDEIIRHCEKLVELEQQLEKEQLQTNIEIPTKK